MAEPVANTQQRTQYAMPSAPSTVSLIRKITLELNSSQPSACVAMNTTPPLRAVNHAAFEFRKEGKIWHLTTYQGVSACSPSTCRFVAGASNK